MSDDIIIRAMAPTGEPSDGKTIFGRIARANEWSEIDSAVEGHFLERNAPGTFRKTFADGVGRIHILFQHGKDPEVGDKPIALPLELAEDSVGAFYRGELFDGVPALVRDGLKAGVYGSSHRFKVIREDWERNPARSDYNPKGLPERTIREAMVMELGPVTWPAFGGSSAAVRSLTDDFLPIPPVAPSDDAGPTPTSPERRDEPVTIEATPIAQETSPVSDNQYVTLDDMGARVRELDAEIKRTAELPGLLPDAEQVAFDEKVAERAKLEHAMTAWRNRLSQVRETAEVETNVERSYPVPTVIRTPAPADIYDTADIDKRARNLTHRGELYRDNAMRAAEITSFPNPNTDVEKSRDRIATILDHHDSPDKQFAQRVVSTGSPVYKRAFNKLLMNQPLTPEEQRGTALAVGVDATGGFSVPFAFDPTVIAIGSWSGAINPYRRACRVIPIVGTDTWNALTATVVTATRTTEAAPAIEQGPTFAQPQLVVTRVQAQVTYSFEMAQDRSDIASEMAQLIAEAKDNEEEASFAVGVGSTVTCIGVLAAYGTSGAYTQMDTIGSTVLAANDALAVEAALPVRHRMGAQWFMNRKTIRAFQALETTGGILFGGNGGYPAVGSDVRNATDGNTGLRLLGYPVNESPSAPVATTSHIIAAALIAPQSYAIVERVGMQVRLIPDIINSSALATGQSAVYAMWRNMAKPLNVDAGRLLDYKT